MSPRRWVDPDIKLSKHDKTASWKTPGKLEVVMRVEFVVSSIACYIDAPKLSLEKIQKRCCLFRL
jgi:hypothetical protein